jgi:hypothetical protein
VRWAVLVHPSANRVYAQVAPALLAAELRLTADVDDVVTERIAGVDYVTFTGSEEAAASVANASSVLALFARDGELLRPVPLARLDRWDDDLVTIPRYVGKTNEQLTHLLVNVAVAVSRAGPRARVLDPVCGRGTTLNVAVLLGHDAVGIDEDARDIDAYLQFFTRWLQDKRAKHETKRSGTRTTISCAPDKTTPRQEVVVIAGDTTTLVQHIGKSSVDAIAGDLPYNVQHRGQVGELLTRCQCGVPCSDRTAAWRCRGTPRCSPAPSC